jgi:hypothetical protein
MNWPRWITEFLTNTAPDVGEKLETDGFADGHAYIWATYTTPYRALATLEVDDTDAAISVRLPSVPPDLPRGVTEVWVGGWFGGGRVLRCRRDGGWSEVYRIPKDGRIEGI